ncbi:MAG: molybdenum ABC transporter ATP-binding protein [Pseudomonadota bacterium]
MLRIKVRKSLGNFTVDVAFSTAAVGVTALFGRSGAGKTSVINMIAGLFPPDEGVMEVNGRTLFDSRKSVDLPPEKRRCGYVFQDGRLFPHLTVKGNLMYGMRLVPRSERCVNYDQVVEMLGIDHILERRPAKLSGGEKQRVAVGRALLTSPSLLLMDEPLASLDNARKGEVLPFVARLPREFSIPIVYVSHSLDEILNLADSVVLLESGRVAATGNVEDLMSQFDLQRFAGAFDAGVVLAAVVEEHDKTGGLTILRFSGGILKVPLADVPVGDRVRVRIRSRDVAIALNRPTKISVQNVFPATVEEMVETSESIVDVRLNIGHPLFSRITPAAKADLDLTPGRQVFALVKSVAISGAGFEEVGASRNSGDAPKAS